MRSLILPGLFLLLLSPAHCLARMEVGLWPLFGMQRNNNVVISNDYTGLGGTARLGWVLDKEAVAGFTLLLDFNYLNFGDEYWFAQLRPRVDKYCDVRSEYRIASLCPGFSFGLQRHRVRPYFEMFGGPASFTIRTNFNNSRWPGDEPVDQDEDLSRNGFVFGAGGGLKLVFWDGADSEKDSWLKSAAVDIKADYQHSGRNEYIIKQNLQRPGSTGPVHYSKSSSRANLLLFHFGCSIQMF